MVMVEKKFSIGVAGPVSLQMLARYFDDTTKFTNGYPFPLISEYVVSLVECGYHVIVYTLCSEIKEPVFIPGNRLSISISPMRARRRWIDLQHNEINALRKEMVKHPASVIHAHWCYEFARAAQLSGIPNLVTMHDSPYRMMKMSIKTNARWIRLSRLLLAHTVISKAQDITVVSQYLNEELIKDFKTKGNIYIVPNGINTVSEKPNYKAKNETKIILSVFSGGFSGRKNGPALLDACNRLFKSGEKFRLILLGSGCELGGEADMIAKKCNYSFDVEFRGIVMHNELLRVMREEADIYVHPSLEESFGMAVLEAMALGLPVIAGSNSGAVPWLLDEGKCGFLADVKNAEDFSKVISSALSDFNRLQHISVVAFERSQSIFSLERMTRAYISHLGRVIESNDREKNMDSISR